MDFPKYIQLETISLCNANCPMCSLKHITDVNRKQRIMSDKLFNKISYELQQNKNKLEKVIVQGLGEPLLDKKIFNRIKQLKSIEIKEVSLSTNGSLLNNENIALLLDSGIDSVDLSIDALNKDTFEAIRIGLNRDEVYKNINNLINERDISDSNLRIRIRTTIQDINLNEINKLYDYWKKRLSIKDIIYGKYVYGWNEEYDNKDKCNKIEKNLLNVFCNYLNESMYIQSDGIVPLCCKDSFVRYKLGDVNKQSIQSIWNSKRVNDMRENQKSIDLCKDCYVWDRVEYD